MDSDTSRGLRYYCQGSIIAVATLIAMVVPILLLLRIGQEMEHSHRVITPIVPLLLLLGLALLMLAGGILSLVGAITLRGSHPDYGKALIATAAAYLCNLWGIFLPGWLGRVGETGALVASLFTGYFMVRATASLLTAQRDTMDLPADAVDFFNRLTRRGWLSWKIYLVVGVAQSVNTLMPVRGSLLMIGFLVILLVLELVAWGMNLSFFMRASRLL